MLLNAARETQNRMLSVKELLALAEVWPVQQKHVHSYMAKTNHISVPCLVDFGSFKVGRGSITCNGLENLFTTITLYSKNPVIATHTQSASRYIRCLKVLHGFVMSPLSHSQSQGCADTFKEVLPDSPLPNSDVVSGDHNATPA